MNDCSSTTDQTTYRLSADYDSGEFTNTVRVSDVDIARDNLSEGVSAFKTEGETGRFEYTGSYRPFDTLTLVYGVDLEKQKLIGSPDSFDRRQNGYYFEYDGAFSKRFFLTAGARYDDNDDFGQHTSSRVTGAYLQDLGGGRSLKYRASYGTGFRPPSLYEIAYNAGPFAFPPAAGLHLSEETSRGYDLGVEYDTKLGLHVEVTYFDQDIHNEIYFDSVGFSGYLQDDRSEQCVEGLRGGRGRPARRRAAAARQLDGQRRERPDWRAATPAAEGSREHRPDVPGAQPEARADRELPARARRGRLRRGAARRL